MNQQLIAVSQLRLDELSFVLVASAPAVGHFLPFASVAFRVCKVLALRSVGNACFLGEP
jgi:hypothetical protein